MPRPITIGLADFSRYCTSHLTIPFISVNFAVLWNAWFSKIFCKTHWSNVFFFSCFFLKSKHNTFCIFFISMLRMTNLFFAFKNKNCCYLCRFYHEYAFELIDWLIWLAHQFWLLHLNKHQLFEISTACNHYHLWCKHPQSMFKIFHMCKTKCGNKTGSEIFA